MQLSPGHHNESRLDRRRLCTKVSGAGELAHPGLGWPPGAGADRDRGLSLQPLWPSTGLERRWWTCLLWKQRGSLPSPVELAWVLPALMGTSGLLPPPTEAAQLLWTHHGYWQHSVIPAVCCGSSRWPTARDTT